MPDFSTNCPTCLNCPKLAKKRMWEFMIGFLFSLDGSKGFDGALGGPCGALEALMGPWEVLLGPPETEFGP